MTFNVAYCQRLLYPYTPYTIGNIDIDQLTAQRLQGQAFKYMEGGASSIRMRHSNSCKVVVGITLTFGPLDVLLF